MKDIPKQYKKVFDVVVFNIVREVEIIIPFIEELGDELEFDVEDFTVSIKKKKKDLKDV